MQDPQTSPEVQDQQNSQKPPDQVIYELPERRLLKKAFEGARIFFNYGRDKYQCSSCKKTFYMQEGATTVNIKPNARGKVYFLNLACPHCKLTHKAVVIA